MKDNYPFCSVIILNYFGEKVIDKTVKSVLNLNYPKKNYEIIIVDNDSQDKSPLILKKFAKKYKQIKLIFSPQNLGFAGGNNLGIKEAQGKYVILLNNDCVVDKNWLVELVKVAEKNEKIFAVGGKLVLYPKFFEYKIKKDNKNILLKKTFLIESKLLNYTKEKKMPINFIEKNEEFVLEIPYDPYFDKKIKIKLQYLNENLKKNTKLIEFKINEVKQFSYTKIQNAGIIVFQDGYGRDIGAKIYYQRQNYEKEKKQYDKVKEIYAGCGASVLYRKSILEKIGLLDENSFMYYEDVDICERARLYGYKSFFSPQSIAYHLHALTAKEWSPFFIYHSEKGRLLHVFFNFPFYVFIKEFFVFTIKSIGRFFKTLFSIKKTKTNIQYIKIIFYFLIYFLFLIIERKKRLKNIDKNSLEKNYQKILSGYWLFN